MAILKTEAVILKQSDYSEADKIITVYSKDFGKIKCIAKGIKRSKSKLRGSLLPFSHSSLLLFKGKNLYTITGADVVYGFIKLRKDFTLLAYTSYIIELLDALVLENEESLPTFALLVSTLHLCTVLDPRAAVKIFELRLLKISGYKPEIEKCVNCGKTDEKYLFSPKFGGILCSRCQNLDLNGEKVTVGTLKIMNLLETTAWNKVHVIKPTQHNFIEMDIVLEKYFLYLLQKRLQTREFLKLLQV